MNRLLAFLLRFSLVASCAACIVIEGPCKVGKADIICTDGGKVRVFAPSHSIESTGKVADSIVKAIAEDPQKKDPKLLIEPRERH